MRPAIAAYAGAAMLVMSTVLINVTDALPYTILLNGLSLAETIAVLELMFFCVRRLSMATAFLRVASLVIADLVAAIGNPAAARLEDRVIPHLVIGLVPIVVVVVIDLRSRRTGTEEPNR